MQDKRERLKHSAVRNELGALQLVHHATQKGFAIEDIAPFSHFGTRTAARARGGQDARLISAHLDIRKPLYIADINDEHSPQHIAELIDAAAKGVITTPFDELFSLDPGTMEEYIIEDLRSAGYDGLGYRNLHEDPGSISWMILDASQVMVLRDGPAVASKDAWELSEEAFTGAALVSDVYSIDGSEEDYEHLWDALREEGPSLPIVARDRSGWEARWLDDWEPEATVGLFDPDGPAQGFYMHGQLWIEPEARGAGRSWLMIAAAADLLGGCPAQNPSIMGYSEAGYAAHLAAHRRVLELAEDNGYAPDLACTGEEGSSEPA